MEMFVVKGRDEVHQTAVEMKLEAKTFVEQKCGRAGVDGRWRQKVISVLYSNARKGQGLFNPSDRRLLKGKQGSKKTQFRANKQQHFSNGQEDFMSHMA